MRLSFRLNGKQVETDVRPDMLLLDLVRDLGCYSVKRGCETANCGLCTVWLDGKPVLSCSTLAIRADGRHVTTLEGLQKEMAYTQINPATGKKFRLIGAPVVKKDAKALVTGKPVYTDDLALKDCLIVKVLRSPHAHALIEEIDCKVASRVPGIECILTWKDVPQKRFTMAGQTYPEPSPYDRLILDQRVRFVGDAVAIIAGETEAAVDHAMRLIKVKYQVLEPVLDMHDSKDGKILVHPEDSWKALCNVGADNKRNLCASGGETHGDLEAAFAGCSHIVEKTYHTKANQQAMMETFRAFTYMDVYGRLNVVDSTQVTFHVRRILAHALDVPKSKIRVIKPRIGGGFGAKQTVVAEVYPAIVTMKTGKPAKIIYSRYESQIASSTSRNGSKGKDRLR